MTRVINGVYRNGQIVLDEVPPGITDAAVRVEFLEPTKENSSRGTMKFGQFFKPGARMSTLEDFEHVRESLTPKVP